MIRFHLRALRLLPMLALVSVCAVAAASCAQGSALNASDECDDGLVPCGDYCVDTLTDPMNCGGCGDVCPSGGVCADGACANSCGPGQTICQGVCVDTQSDPANCGSCGTACAQGTTCVAGACAAGCPPNLTSCGGVCTDTQSDAQHCGSCTNACAPGVACVGGSCQVTGGPCDNSGVCGDGTTGCTACAFAGACADELDACLNSIDCLDFNDCISLCSDQACVNACAALYPTGATIYNDLALCAFCEECYIDCDGANIGCP